MSFLVDLATKEISESDSIIGFELSSNNFDRYLTVEGQRAYNIGNGCGTCAYLFERMGGANTTVDVGELTRHLESGLKRLDDTLVSNLARLMPNSCYRVALLRLFPNAVKLGSQHDYFATEQIENEGGVDPFWGLPHHPKVPYYRAGDRDISFDRGRLNGQVGRLFEFVVPMFPGRWLSPERTSYYETKISEGVRPTAVAISVLDVKGPATCGIDHWCISHYLLDGHHKVAAAARARQQITMVAFLAVNHSIATEAEVDAALAALD